MVFSRGLDSSHVVLLRSSRQGAYIRSAHGALDRTGMARLIWRGHSFQMTQDRGRYRPAARVQILESPGEGALSGAGRRGPQACVISRECGAFRPADRGGNARFDANPRGQQAGNRAWPRWRYSATIAGGVKIVRPSCRKATVPGWWAGDQPYLGRAEGFSSGAHEFSSERHGS